MGKNNIETSKNIKSLFKEIEKNNTTIKKILLIDNNETDVKKIKYILKNRCFVSEKNINCVNDPYEAINIILKNGFDLIISDLNFDKKYNINGFELVSAAFSANKRLIITSKYNKFLSMNKIKSKIKNKDYLKKIRYIQKPYLEEIFLEKFYQLDNLECTKNLIDIYEYEMNEIENLKKNSIFYKFPFLSWI